jgi:hypothetical protein
MTNPTAELMPLANPAAKASPKQSPSAAPLLEVMDAFANGLACWKMSL